MELPLPTILSVLSLLAISSGVFFLAKKIKTPYTVLLVVFGLFLVPLSQIPLFSFIKEFALTPSILFYVFLPILIFESSYNMSARKLMNNVRSISLLSVVSLLISAFFVGLGIHFIFGWFGFDVPFLLALIFGALISATDPVAVLALFKEYGAPRRLSIIFEGESLFNDGTAVALFLVLLEIGIKGFHGTVSVLEGIAMFMTMVAGGILFGLFMGILFSKAIEWTRSNEAVTITLMFVLAHLTFVLTELLSSHLVIMGEEIKISAIISTLIASMVVGNYGRTKILPRAEEFIEKFWSQAAFMANSVVFLLIGLLFATISVRLEDFIWPIIGGILIVAISRAISVYPVIAFLNRTKKEQHIPMSWQHLLAWGSLRGALAVTVVLLVPADLQFAGWNYDFTPREFIMALTIGCIFATLFIKATTIGPIMRKLKVNDLTDIEKETREGSLILVHGSVLSKLDEMLSRGFIDKSIYDKLFALNQESFKEVTAAQTTLKAHPGHALITRQVLEIQALATEKQVLKTLFMYNEITEPVYKKILNRLNIQLESAEAGNTNIDRVTERDHKNFVDVVMDAVNNFFPQPSREVLVGERYMYYRAQSIIARKAYVVLEEMIKDHAHVFNQKIASEILHIYREFQLSAENKMKNIAEEQKETIKSLNESLARKGLFKVKERQLAELKEREMITPKLYVSLLQQFEKEGRL